MNILHLCAIGRVHCLYILFKLLRPGTVWNQALCPLKKCYNKWSQLDTNHRLENPLQAWNSGQPLHQIWPLTAWNDFKWRLKTSSNILLENSPVRTVHFRARKIRIIDIVVMFINITKNGNYCIQSPAETIHNFQLMYVHILTLPIFRTQSHPQHFPHYARPSNSQNVYKPGSGQSPGCCHHS